jgi:hypothetical protein
MVPLQTAAAALGFGRTKAYDLVRIGKFPVPVRHIGERYLVPVVALLAYLGADEPEPAAMPIPPQRSASAGLPSGVRPVPAPRRP